MTEEHPLWTRIGWKAAGDLAPGDEVAERGGSWARVERIGWTGRAVTVYNFEVRGTHSYAVGEVGVWAHNACRSAPRLSASQKEALRQAARDIWKERMGVSASSQGLQVHHRIPLEYAHLFPRADPNRAANLVGVTTEVHEQISGAWSGFRVWLGGRTPVATEVLSQATAIDRLIAVGEMVFLR